MPTKNPFMKERNNLDYRVVVVVDEDMHDWVMSEVDRRKKNDLEGRSAASLMRLLLAEYASQPIVKRNSLGAA